MGLDDIVDKAKDAAGDLADKAKDVAGDLHEKADGALHGEPAEKLSDAVIAGGEKAATGLAHAADALADKVADLGASLDEKIGTPDPAPEAPAAPTAPPA